MMHPAPGQILLPIARATIARQLGRQHLAAEDAGWLRERGACFVTLTQGGELRGCIGTLRAHRTLLDDLKANALAAAFRDPRFQPLSVDELDRTSVELSLLSALEPIEFEDERHALSLVRPGIDGIVFQYGHHQSTYLPQVWEELSEPEDFMANLKHKAGLPPDFWDPEVKLARYTVSKWSETP